MADTLNELVLLNAGLRSCVPPELGCLRDLTVLDLSFNQLQGTLPESMAAMRGLQQLDVAHNQLWGHIPDHELRMMCSENAAKLYRHPLPEVVLPL